jgi:hypothetical protein
VLSRGKKAGATRAVEAKTTGIRPPLIEAYVSVGFFTYFSLSLWLFKLIRVNCLIPKSTGCVMPSPRMDFCHR